MKLSRDITTKIRHLLDEFLPPFLHDSPMIMSLFFIPIFGKGSGIFLEFKEELLSMSQRNYDLIYRSVQKCSIDRQTDLNQLCLRKILTSIKGKSVLDVGCGEGYLCHKLERSGYSVSGVDIHINRLLRKKYKKINFYDGKIENLPFKNKSFDTVVCSHVLEHILYINKGINELRRVCRKRLIIIVPKQRPYKYTFDLHIHFFPYKFTLMGLLGVFGKKRVCYEYDGDLFFVEDR